MHNSLGTHLTIRISSELGLEYNVVDKAVFNALNDILKQLGEGDELTFPNGSTMKLTHKVGLRTHISQLTDAEKIAGRLCDEKALINDKYHNNITKAAKMLCGTGRNQFRYFTQYQSGNSLWFHPNGNDEILVDISAGTFR